LAAGSELAPGARRAILDGDLNVSPISAWEIANLVRKNRMALTMPVAKWFRQALDAFGATTPELTIEVLAGSCELPGSPPTDPADRILIALARETRMVLVTRDKSILAYSQAGHVGTLVC
jgi:PIN domain nuclease of toxin-antitoxin system